MVATDVVTTFNFLRANPGLYKFFQEFCKPGWVVTVKRPPKSVICRAIFAAGSWGYAAVSGPSWMSVRNIYGTASKCQHLIYSYMTIYVDTCRYYIYIIITNYYHYYCYYYCYYYWLLLLLIIIIIKCIYIYILYIKNYIYTCMYTHCI